MQPRAAFELNNAQQLFHIEYQCSQNGHWYPLNFQGSSEVYYTRSVQDARQVAGVVASRTASRRARVMDQDDRIIYQEN